MVNLGRDCTTRENAIFSGESRGFEPSDQDVPNGLGVKRSQVQILSPRLVGAGRPFSFVDGWRGEGSLLVIPSSTIAAFKNR